MLVTTRKTNEATVIDNRVTVVLTKILETQVTVNVSAVEPFDACLQMEFGSRGGLRVPNTNFEFVLQPGQSILIDEEITVIFVVARSGEGQPFPKARIAFDAPPKTRLSSKDARGSTVSEFEFGAPLQAKK